MKKWTTLGKQKLASSGITTAIADKLGMYEVPSAAQLSSKFNALPALIIPYFDVAGKAMRAASSEFYRLRYLAKGNSIVDLATEKSQRYAQPPRSGVRAYFPKILDWAAITADTTVPIIITEGELKAAAAAACDFATIGLGGVWNFRSAGDGVLFLPELEAVNWAYRLTYICYDSDVLTNPNVAAAVNFLAEELMERGALVHLTYLPAVDDDKTGLDDFLLAHTPSDFDDLLMRSERLTVVRTLWEMNRQVVFVDDPGLVLSMRTGQKMSPSHFKEYSRYSTTNTVEPYVTKDGEVGLKKVAAAPVWLKWPMRNSVERVTYKPGEERITKQNEFNQWLGWGVEPEKGNVKPFLELVDFLFSDAEPADKEWFLDWLAFPIQNPGVKMFASVVVHGEEQGTGKSLIGYTMGEIYGKNFKEITDQDLESDYNAWAENKQFVMGDDISGKDSRQHTNTLKRMITQRSMTINIKFIPQYTVPDCVNYYFTSNHADAFFLEDKDRRFFVTEVFSPPLPMEFYTKYDKWLWQAGGPAALFHWLKTRKISKDFDHRAPARDTTAKKRMITNSKGELTSWVQELKDYPEQVLRTGQLQHTRDLFTATELLNFYKARYPDTRVTAIGLGRQLSNAGVPQVLNGNPVPHNGESNRYYAVRNGTHWRKVTKRADIQKELGKQPVRSAGTKV